MTSHATVADFMEAHADLLTIDNNQAITVNSVLSETKLRTLLLALFEPTDILKAGPNRLSPLVPGHQYTLDQRTLPEHPTLLLLNNATPEQGVGSYAISVIDFMNVFADTPLPSGSEQTPAQTALA